MEHLGKCLRDEPIANAQPENKKISLCQRSAFPTSIPPVAQHLKGQIKDRCGAGWDIADQDGDTQLTRRINDDRQHKNLRQSVQLGVMWNPAYSGDIFLKICQLKQLVDVHSCSLAEAKKKLYAKDIATPTITRSVQATINRQVQFGKRTCHCVRIVQSPSNSSPAN